MPPPNEAGWVDLWRVSRRHRAFALIYSGNTVSHKNWQHSSWQEARALGTWQLWMYHPNFPDKLSGIAILPDSWDGRGRPCQVSLHTLPFQAFLWGSIGWPAEGCGLSQEDSSSLLSKVWHHVCCIFETLGRQFFLASLQDIMDSPRELPQLLFQIEWWRYPKPE